MTSIDVDVSEGEGTIAGTAETISSVTEEARVEDEVQTVDEAGLNRWVARFSIVYLLIMLTFLAWMLFDTWVGQHSLSRWLGYDLDRLDTPTFRLIFYTIIGGGLGGTVNGIRSTLKWHQQFDRQHIWKYIAAPWLGTTLALFVYALLNSGISVLVAGSVTDTVDTTQVLSMFSVGALAGYGSRDVFIWLDAQVTKLFAVDEEEPEDAPSETAAEATHEEDNAP